jgi:hypothetical protein
LDKKQLGVETNWGVERRVETNVSIGDWTSNKKNETNRWSGTSRSVEKVQFCMALFGTLPNHSQYFHICVMIIYLLLWRPLFLVDLINYFPSTQILFLLLAAQAQQSIPS